MVESKTFLVSDLHLWHSNIIRYCNRPFSDVQEMSNRLIQNWNDAIKPDDRVFFLGDFAFGTRDTVIKSGQRLNGRKVFIYGNHDKYNPQVYYDAGFEHVSRWPIVIQNKYLLSHAPFRIDGNQIYPGPLINIHGHVHDKLEYAPTISSRSACVCVERWDYKPVELTVIKRMIEVSKGRDIDEEEIGLECL